MNFHFAERAAARRGSSRARAVRVSDSGDGALLAAPSRTPNTGASTRENSRGFTMLELMVVIAIILVLIGMAAGRYEKSVVRAREAVLKQDLQTMRNAIQQYTLDKAAGPQSIDDLVSAGYLREVPTDPMTRARDWHTDFDNVLLSTDQTSPGITDVHSTADAVSPFENTPYSSW